MKPTKSHTKAKPLIILTAGGTGGHVFPAESLAEELTSRGYRLALVTDRRGKDNYRGKLREIPNYSVCAGALVGKSKLFKIKSLFKTCIGILQACWILYREKPACVIGFGGYASFPCSMAAILLGIDLVIHEQNSVMSRTNRFLSKYAALIAQSFRKVKYTPPHIKTILTGMPIRKAIADINSRPYPDFTDGKLHLIVLGGSQGAKVFSEVVPAAICSLPPELQEQISLCQQCREADIPEVQKAYQNSRCEHTISHFFNNMPELYSTAHLIISRAGASSVCEIAAVGLPSILVPLPIAADDHQTANAQEIADVKGGIVLRQKDFTADKLAQLLADFLADKNKLSAMSQNTKKAGIINAGERFADALEKEIIRHR